MMRLKPYEGKINKLIVHENLNKLIALYKEYITHLENACPAEFASNEKLRKSLIDPVIKNTRRYPNQTGFVDFHNRDVTFAELAEYRNCSKLINKLYLMVKEFKPIDDISSFAEKKLFSALEIAIIIKAITDLQPLVKGDLCKKIISEPRNETLSSILPENTAGAIFFQRLIPIYKMLRYGLAGDEEALSTLLQDEFQTLHFNYSRHLASKAGQPDHIKSKQAALQKLQELYEEMKTTYINIPDTIAAMRKIIKENYVILTMHSNSFTSSFKNLFSQTKSDNFVTDLTALLDLIETRSNELGLVSQPDSKWKYR